MAIGGRQDHVRLLWRRLFVGLVAFAAVVVGFAVVGVYRKERGSAALRAQAQTRLDDLEHRHEKLAADVALLSTDRGKEKMLRGQYDVGRQGERLIVIVEPPAPPARATTTPWYQRLKWW